MKLERELALGKASHAYLFVGNDKEEIATAVKLMIEKNECTKEDIVEIDMLSTDVAAASKKSSAEKSNSGEITADLTREFIHQLNLSSFGKCRVGIIWQAERLNRVSANILLKTLEEPPRNVVIILVSQTENVLPTIRSRCRLIRFGQVAYGDNHTFSYSEISKDQLAGSFKRIEEIVKNDQVEAYLTQMISFYEKEMLAQSSPKIAKFIHLILETQKKIKGNANKRLVLENLILKAKNYV